MSGIRWRWARTGAVLAAAVLATTGCDDEDVPGTDPAPGATSPSGSRAEGRCTDPTVANTACGPFQSLRGTSPEGEEMDLSGVVELSATGGLDGDTPTLVVRHEDCAVWNVGLRIDGDRWVPDQSDREEVAMVCPEPPASRAWVEEVVNGPFTVGPAPEGQWLLESGDASILLTNDSTRLELPAG